MSNKDTVRQFFDISNELMTNKADVSALDPFFESDFTQHMGQFPLIDFAKFKQMASASNDAFSDARISIKDVIEEGDKVAAYVVWEGMHTGEVWGIPATHKVISTEAVHIFRFVGSKIAEMWSVSDAAGMQQQLTATE